MALIRAAIVAGFAIQFCAATDPLAAMWSPSVHELVLSHLPAAIAAALLGSLVLVLIDRKFPTTAENVA